MADDPLAPDPSQISQQGPAPDVGVDPGTMTPQLAGSPGSQASAGPPRPGRPILMDLISGLISPKMQAPAPGQMARPVSRLDTFESFLGNFINALGTGMANAGHGPGANLRGAGAAIGAPYQQAVQQYQLGQQAQAQQAQIQSEQARTQLTQAQAAAAPAEAQAKIAGLTAQPRFDPATRQYIGTMTDAQYTQYVKGQGASQVSAQAKMSVAQMQAMLAMGQVSKIVPAQGQDGKMVMRALNKYGQPLGDIDGAVPPASYLEKFKNSLTPHEMADGSIQLLPSSSQTGVITGLGNKNGKNSLGGTSKIKPGAPVTAPATPPGQIMPPGSGKGSFDMMTGSMPDGTQIAGNIAELKAAGVQGVTKLPAADASKVSIARQLTSPGGLFDNVEKDIAAFKPEELTALGARWNEFQTGTLGTGDPRYAALRTDAGLLSTALMQAHVGSRGGEQMMEHFKGLADAGKMNGDILKTAIATEKRYVQEKAMRPPVKTSGQSSIVDSLVKKHGG